MNALSEGFGNTQHLLLHQLLRNKTGLTVDALAQAVGITRNAVRQHLMSLERDGLLAKGGTQPSGGRPEHLFVLTQKGQEIFPRQYSWFSELLLEQLEAQLGTEGLRTKLAEMGRSVGASLQARLHFPPDPTARVTAIANLMREIGYEASATHDAEGPVIEALNCVFHKLAEKCPDVCGFDIAMLSGCSGCRVEHRACMVRGDNACRFHFLADKADLARPG
jgi:predicted ArsR family transcriptional regulator